MWSEIIHLQEVICLKSAEFVTGYSCPCFSLCVCIHQTQANLSSIRMILFLICVQEFGQTKICDLDVLWSLHEDIPCCQVTVYQVALLKVVHTLLSKNNDKQGVTKAACI